MYSRGMTKMRVRLLVVLGATLVAVAIAIVLLAPLTKDIPAGTGYAAWQLCTRTFQSGEDFDHVRTAYVEPKVRQLPMIWNVDHVTDAGQKKVSVSTKLPTMEHARTAVFREGLGCTLVAPGETEGNIRAQTFEAAAELPVDARPWPLGEGAAETERFDAATQKVIEAHADVFDEPADPSLTRQYTTALLVARGGHLIYERYGQNYTREQPQLGWSMTKTLTAIVAGVMARDGKLAIDSPVGLAQWNNTPKAKITWRQLLNMAPGLAWFEGYGGSSDATQMLFSQRDQGAWAADRPLESAPGTVLTYSTGFTNIAMLRLKQLAGGTHQAIYNFYQRELFAPLGIRHAVIEPDASGTPVGGARGMLRAVDWMRLGQLVANNGQWNDTQVLTPDYVEFLTSASPASPEYAGSMWLRDAEHIAPEMRGKLPKELAWFAGYMGQYVIVVPSRQLVVLRMGASLDQQPVTDRVFSLVIDLLALKS